MVLIEMAASGQDLQTDGTRVMAHATTRTVGNCFYLSNLFACAKKNLPAWPKYSA
jgi:hypothetical protein